MLPNKREKHGGRTKGTPNKVKHPTKALIQNVLDENLERLPEYFEELTAREKVDAMIRLLPFIIAKQNETLIKEDTENVINTVQIEIIKNE